MNLSRLFRIATLLATALALSACGYNTLQQQDEQVKASWSEVINQYQRRADLIPNLVSTVKGYAEHEEKVFTEVAVARAGVGSIAATPAILDDPVAFEKYRQAQGELSGALGRLLAVSENYPQLKADTGFRDLQAQLEGTENRIAVARNRYVKAVEDYNVTVRSFPSNLTAKAFGFAVKPNFSVDNVSAVTAPPQVSFDGKQPGTPLPSPSAPSGK